MLWKIEFNDATTGWSEVDSGRLFDDAGTELHGDFGYSPTDTAPVQPAWYVEPEPYVYEPPPPLSWSDPNLSAEYFWIDVGPFFDRFGAKALAITSSTDPLIQGLVTLILPRKYIDLKRADLPSLVSILVGKGVITSDDMTTVLAQVTAEDERHIKGLPQPE